MHVVPEQLMIITMITTITTTTTTNIRRVRLTTMMMIMMMMMLNAKVNYKLNVLGMMLADSWKRCS